MDLMADDQIEEEQIESSRGKGSKFSCENTGSGMGTGDDSADGSVRAGSSPSKSNSSSKPNNADDKESNKREGSSRDRSSRVRNRIPENFCRDYIFFRCSRKDCKFKHPSPDSQEYKDALASRPGWHSRDRSRSPHNRSSSSNNNNHSSSGGDAVAKDAGSKDKPTVCRDFLRNNCFRGKDCRFAHPNEGESEDLPWPQLCLDYRAGNCERFDCRFLHYSQDDEDYFLRTGTVRKELWQHFATITLKDSKLLNNRPVCKVFLQNGQCVMSMCRYRHLTQKEYDEEIYQVMTRMVYERCRRIHKNLPPPPGLGSFPGDSVPPRDDFARSGPGGPGAHGLGLRSFDSSDGIRSLTTPAVDSGRQDFEWSSSPYGFSKPDGPINMDAERLSKENNDLRRIISEDAARYKSDVERLNLETLKLKEELSFMKSKAGQSGTLPQQMSLLQQENTELTNKMKSVNDWSVELQAKYSTARRECDELRDSVKVLNLELATVNEEKVKLQRKSDELEAKLQVSQANKEEANLAIEKKEYLETKLKQYYDAMKRCEAEFVATLDKNFNIKTPQVMSYFPTWGYLMSFVTEIVAQINGSATSSASIGTGYPTASSSFGGGSNLNSAYSGNASVAGFGSSGAAYGSTPLTSSGNFNAPPPTAAGGAANMSQSGGPSAAYTGGGGSGGYGQDYGGNSSQYGGAGGNYYGNNSGGYGGSSYNNSYGNNSGGSGGDKSRSSSKSGSKDGMMNSMAWKKRS